jgi:hypothetical protein
MSFLPAMQKGNLDAAHPDRHGKITSGYESADLARRRIPNLGRSQRSTCADSPYFQTGLPRTQLFSAANR